MNAVAWSAIALTSSGVVSLEQLTPALSKRMTGHTRDTVDDRRVPGIHLAREVLQEDEGNAVRSAEAPVGETDPVGFHELRGGGQMRMHHRGLPFS